MKTYSLFGLYYKAGDDLQHHLSASKTPAAALVAHAEQLEGAAKTLRRLAGTVAGDPEIELAADAHYIGVTGPEAVLAPYVKENILVEEEDPEDDREEDPDEDEDEDDGDGEDDEDEDDDKDEDA